jgi:uncharacterized protein
MLLDLSKLLLQDGKSLTARADLEMTELRFRMGRFPLVRKTPLELTVVNTGNRVLEIKGSGELTLSIPCARCLEPVEYSFVLDFEREVDMKLTAEERERQLEETNFMEGEQLDPDVLARNELLIHWPMRVLCKEDCKGICSCCGANRNHTSCNCDTRQGDPRMAAIRDIFSKCKEV